MFTTQYTLNDGSRAVAMTMLPPPPTKLITLPWQRAFSGGEKKKEEYAKPHIEGKEVSYGKIGLTTVAVTQDLLSGMPLVLKIELIRLWSSRLPEPGQPSAQLSKLICLTACKKAMHASSRWYRTSYMSWCQWWDWWHYYWLTVMISPQQLLYNILMTNEINCKDNREITLLPMHQSDVWRWLLCRQLYSMCILRELATAISVQVTSVRLWDWSNTVPNMYRMVSLHGAIVKIIENRVIVNVYLQELCYILLVKNLWGITVECMVYIGSLYLYGGPTSVTETVRHCFTVILYVALEVFKFY